MGSSYKGVPGIVLMLLLLVAGSAAPSSNSSPFEVLGIPRGASNAEVKKAYRKMALTWHPDKCTQPKEECTGKFQAIAEAYDAIINGADDGQGGAPRPPCHARPSRRGGREAHTVFDEMFGESAWQQWQPGDYVDTHFTRNGKRVRLEIFPDGTSAETESEAAGQASGFRMKKTRTAGGQTFTSIHFDGTESFVEQLLIAFGVPLVVASVVGFLCPKLCCLGCLWLCCFRGRRRRGGTKATKAS